MTYCVAHFKILHQLHHTTSAFANILMDTKFVRLMLTYIALIHLFVWPSSLPFYDYTQIYWSLWQIPPGCFIIPVAESPSLCPDTRDFSSHWLTHSTQHSASQPGCSVPCHLLPHSLSLRWAFWSSNVFPPCQARLFGSPVPSPKHKSHADALQTIVTNHPRPQLNKRVLYVFPSTSHPMQNWKNNSKIARFKCALK